MTIEFSEISTTGNWIKGSDLVGNWVMFHTKSVEKRNGQFGEQYVAIVDFVNLSNGNSSLIFGAAISSSAIVSTLQNQIGKYVVGLIEKVPSKKGQDAIIITQPKGLQYESAKSKAKEILEGKPADTPTHDDLEDLLS